VLLDKPTWQVGWVKGSMEEIHTVECSQSTLQKAPPV
jgi:hypothetical protein